MARTVEPRERSLANGIFTSGTSIGALIAPALILAIAASMGWRRAFMLLGAAGALWFGGWVLSTRNPKLAPVWKEAPGETGEPRLGLARVVAQID